MAATTANWMMLERFVFRRDDTESFPGSDATPFTANGSFLGCPFTIALHLAKPPYISHLYLHWPGGRNPEKGDSCILVSAHRNLLLFRLIADPEVTDRPSLLDPEDPHVATDSCAMHNHFICRALPSKSPLMLQEIPMCTTPVVLFVKDGEKITTERWFNDINPVGILCRGEDEFAIAQLSLSSRPSQSAKVLAELCVLRSKVDNSDHKWEVEQHLPIKYQQHELSDLLNWTTDTIVPFNNHLCWVSYSVGGVMFCKVFEESPLITYVRLPIRNRCLTYRPFLEKNCSVCVTKTTIGGRGYDQLKFIDIACKDSKLNGSLSDKAGFSITCHSLRTTENNGMEWEMIFFIRSDELWTRNPLLPHEALMFPLVSMDEPSVVYFLLSEHKGSMVDDLSVVAIDMHSKLVIAENTYITQKDISSKGKHADMIGRRFSLLQSFFPSEIPKWLNLPRYLHLTYLFVQYSCFQFMRTFICP
jgi:hypothetical protein